MKLISLLALSLSGECLALTYCSTRKFVFPDPHQSSDLVARFVTSQNHASLFEKPAVIETIRRANPVTWTLSLKKDGPIDSNLVISSLTRQLMINAATESEEEAFLPAKSAGLDGLLKRIQAKGSREIQIEFTRPIEEAELKSLFGPPVGIVLPASPSRNKGYGKFPATLITEELIKLGPEEKPAYTMKFVDPAKVTLKEIMKEDCKRLYYPPADIKKELAKSGTLIQASTTLLYIRIFPGLPKALIERLRASLHPDRMHSLKNFPRTNMIMKESAAGTSMSSPLKDNPDLPTTFLTCDHAFLSPQTRTKLEEELKEAFKYSLGVDLLLSRIGCDRIALVRSSGDRLGSLSAIEFRTKIELENFLRCEQGINIFGSCSSAPSDVIEAEVLSKGKVFPLALIRNEFVEFFQKQ